MGTEVLKKQNQDALKIKRELSVEEGDYVCINSDGFAEKASRNSIGRMPAIGRVVKVRGDHCYVKRFLLEEDYTGVTPRATFYIGLEGQLTDEPPKYSEGDRVQQVIGFGLSDELIMVSVDPTNAIVLTP